MNCERFIFYFLNGLVLHLARRVTARVGAWNSIFKKIKYMWVCELCGLDLRGPVTACEERVQAMHTQPTTTNKIRFLHSSI